MFPSIEDFHNQTEKIAIVGLGYVGLPLAACMASKFEVIGFDINQRRVGELKKCVDNTGELSQEQLTQVNIHYSSDPSRLAEARLLVITVPTPINNHKHPDLTPVLQATRMVGQYMGKGSIVVYESTVYPGVTEDICIPLLEESSGLKAGEDFKVGYSPERVNPGDKEHTVPHITKVVSGQDKLCGELLAAIYGAVIEAGIHLAPNIRTAEAAKVIENIQRDLNIALFNELSLIFNKLDIDTQEVINAAASKWNFLRFEPGMVGGHCIGVDPYYLTYKAEEIGYHPDVILAGRRINDGMGKYVAEQTVKKLIEACKPVKASRVLIMGLTFKENVPDIRNTRVVDIYHELREYGVITHVYDPWADPDEVKHEYGLDLIQDIESRGPYDAILMAVRHDSFRDYALPDLWNLSANNPVLIDVKGMYERQQAREMGFIYWRL
ncbi:MAG: nucleotide sugar dehydrogenase [Syntrophomonas sp.]